MITLTSKALEKAKEFKSAGDYEGYGLRLRVIGGGCSGFTYSLEFDKEAGPMDDTFEQDGLFVFVDALSLQYLDGTEVDYLETLEGAGFKFQNPAVKGTCGCGSSFSV